MTEATTAPRRVPLSVLDNIRVASPCPMRWEQLDPLNEGGASAAGAGADHVRHCGRCDLNVYNFANLSREESVALIERHGASGQRLCGALYRRPDGTILTADCPVGLAAVRRKAVAFFSRAAAAALLLASSAVVYASRQGEAWHPRARLLEPLRTSSAWLKDTVDRLRGKPPAGPMIMGDICLPPLPQNVPEQAGDVYYKEVVWDRG